MCRSDVSIGYTLEVSIGDSSREILIPKNLVFGDVYGSDRNYGRLGHTWYGWSGYVHSRTINRRRDNLCQLVDGW